MLSKLSISNYAIIEELNISFDKGFNVITGETGAGKSIMLGALGLIIGKRADTSVLFDSSKKCIVEATFDITDLLLKSFFEENNLDYEPQTIIRREISSAGKSRAFINDTPVTLNQLKELTQYLIDIHSQHQTLQLNAVDFQFTMLDAFSNLKNKLAIYAEAFKKYSLTQKELSRLIEKDKQSSLDIDYYQFQLSELQEAKFVEGEQETLEAEANVLNNAEKIKENLFRINEFFIEENGPSEQIRSIVSSFSEIKDYSEELSAIYDRLNSVYLELDDVTGDISRLKDLFDVDRERLEFVNARLDNLFKLQQKHRVSTISELNDLMLEIEERLTNVSGVSEKIEELRQLEKEQLDLVLKIANEISVIRVKNTAKLKQEIENYLAQLGMAEAQIDIRLSQLNVPTSNGVDSIEMFIAANKGGALNSIEKVASGGELSRLMLSIKTIISSRTNLPTIIFDEIDTGVSGVIADKMAEIMKFLSKETQVFSITHLPQIAAKANLHYVVYKDSSKDRTYSNLKQLSENERVGVLAKMLSGEKVSQAALDNAAELLK